MRSIIHSNDFTLIDSYNDGLKSGIEFHFERKGLSELSIASHIEKFSEDTILDYLNGEKKHPIYSQILNKVLENDINNSKLNSTLSLTKNNSPLITFNCEYSIINDDDFLKPFSRFFHETNAYSRLDELNVDYKNSIDNICENAKQYLKLKEYYNTMSGKSRTLLYKMKNTLNDLE